MQPGSPIGKVVSTNCASPLSRNTSGAGDFIFAKSSRIFGGKKSDSSSLAHSLPVAKRRRRPVDGGVGVCQPRRAVRASFLAPAQPAHAPAGNFLPSGIPSHAAPPDFLSLQTSPAQRGRFFDSSKSHLATPSRFLGAKKRVNAHSATLFPATCSFLTHFELFAV